MKEAFLDNYVRPLLSAFGYYKIKSSIRMHFYLKRLRKEDELKRLDIVREIEEMPLTVLWNKNDLIVSLTSYGHRIIDSLPYTLYSLLRQEVLPEKIVVFLSKRECGPETLPDILKKIEENGVEFYYVDDIRSYKKLIPALQMFPNNPILTVDDDTYYDKKIIRYFLDEYYNSDKRTVLGTIGRMVTRKNGKFLPYSQWEKLSDETCRAMAVSFYGCGGCLYPPHIFDKEIFNKDVFMELAPTADDLWFWVMEQRNGIRTKLLPQYDELNNIPVDRTTLFNFENCLTSINDGQKMNDVQLAALVEKYKLN